VACATSREYIHSREGAYAAQALDAGKHIETRRTQMSNVRVLCVENHIEYLDALKYMLETAGCEVLSATMGSTPNLGK
jgi:hypothetical protein